MLVRTHLQDLKEVTNNVHYENYRCRKLAGVTGGAVDKIPNRVRTRCIRVISVAVVTSRRLCLQNPLAQIEEERREHHNKLLKMEREMEEVFERKVRFFLLLRVQVQSTFGKFQVLAGIFIITGTIFDLKKYFYCIFL